MSCIKCNEQTGVSSVRTASGSSLEGTGGFDYATNGECQICVRCLFFWIFLAVAELLIYQGRK